VKLSESGVMERKRMECGAHGWRGLSTPNRGGGGGGGVVVLFLGGLGGC